MEYGRDELVPVCPNPLFLQWLVEWRDAAAERQHKSQIVYEKAIRSLTMYPLPLRNGREARILYGFGDGICNRLDEKLAEYYAEHGRDAPIHYVCDPVPVNAAWAERKKAPGARSPAKAASCWAAESVSEEEDAAEQRPSPSKRRRQENREEQEYKPQKRSGGYALLLTFYREAKKPGYRGFMTKGELQRKAQPLCRISFTHFKASYRYNAWSSISALIQKDLVIKTGFPARFTLTEKGLKLGEKLNAEHLEQERLEEVQGGAVGTAEPILVGECEEDQPPATPAAESAVQLPPFPTEPGEAPTGRLTDTVLGTGAPAETPSTTTCAPRHRQPAFTHVPEFTLRPGDFDVVLCIDFIETTAGASHRKRELVTELRKNKINFDVRKLHVGDFLWVARERLQHCPGQPQPVRARELVLDYVVERKRMDDLCGSIVDGRFREQKFRMKRCGLRNRIYLVEDCSFVKHLSLPESTLQQAIVNTQVVDGFFVKRTKDVKESAAYLTIMTRYLQNLYLQKTLVSCRKEEQVACSKEETDSNTCILLTFNDFNEGAMKNRAQTVKEVFAKQLMQINGISGEKAVAILGHYDSVASLMKAYEACPTALGREKLLSNIKCGNTQRNLGPALSKTVSQLYCTEGPLC
ncbi:crossover junction endonuclease MUS81 isoform X2 [Pristis pectinata]|uniref:crossover junction endonuclease MUS81 isoform X2 n=1 Tax=Pristis pectinata TaxID=685728 RepID=UPI00223C9505|nr:crossover junction endonuclease MUS81 isoform X2 [Pristis pectinata]